MKRLHSCAAYLVIGAVIVVGGSARADDGLALLKVEPGARASGMGGAFVSIADDPFSPIYNPAALAGVTKFSASFGHTVYWDDIRLETGAFATNLNSRLFAHGAVRYATVDQLEFRTAPTAQPEGLFDANDLSFKGGLAYRVTPKVTVGFGMGWFIEKIEAWRGSAFNVDLGVQVTPRENVSLGASATNLGSDFILENAGQPGSRDIGLPKTYRAGGSYRYDHYTGAVDVVVVDDDPHVHVGAEADLHELFSVRAGYMTGYDTKNFTAGAALTHRNIRFDYAFVPYSNDLGTTHLFNLTFEL